MRDDPSRPRWRAVWAVSATRPLQPVGRRIEATPARSLTGMLLGDTLVAVHAGSDGVVRVYDADGGQTVRTVRWDDTDRRVARLDTAGGPLLLQIEQTGLTIIDLDPAGGGAERTLRDGTSILRSVAGGPGELAATGDQEGRVVLWDVPSGRPLWRAEHAPTGWVTAVAVVAGPRGPVVVSGGEDGRIRVFDGSDGTPWAVSAQLGHGIVALDAVTRDGVLVVAAAAATANETGDPRHSDSARLWRGGLDGSPDLLGDASGDVRSLAFSHDGAHLVTGAADGAVCLWETGSARLVDRARDHHTTAVRAMATGGDARRSWLLTADQRGGLRQWRIRATGGADRPALLTAGPGPHSAVLVAGPDEDPELVRLTSGARLSTLHGERPVAAVGFSSGDAQLIATAESTGAVTVREAATGSLVHATATRPELTALTCVGRRGTVAIVTGHAGGTVLCTMPDGRQTAIALPAGQVDCLVTTGGDRPAVVAFGGRTCTVIDPDTGTVLRTASLSLLRAAAGAVRSPTDPATAVLACATNGTVYRIDVNGPLVTGVLAAPVGIDRLAAVRTVVAGIETGTQQSGATLCTWDPETGQPLGRFRLPGPVRAMTSAGDDLVVWHGAALTRLTWRAATR